MTANICKFIPKADEAARINILNFVYETKKQTPDKIYCDACFKMYFVTNGRGRVRMAEKACEIEKNDVFFTFPSTHYCIESGEAFEYMYISCLGTRINQIADTYGITKKSFVFKNFPELAELWQKPAGESGALLAMRCEGILLYTFSKIVPPTEDKRRAKNEIVPEIKKYIDENFTDADLSLDKISLRYSYNKKYISTLFKRETGTGISQYLQALRIQYACALIEQGFTSVKDIAFLCGYNEALYFSKAFKSKTGTSPREHINSQFAR